MPLHRSKRIPAVFVSALALIISSSSSSVNAFVTPQHCQISSLPRPALNVSPTITFSSAASHSSEALGVASQPSKPRTNNFLRSYFTIDKKKIAKLGVAFAITYNIISNINGSVTLSMAWYLASKKTGLSPLAIGQWKALVAAYANLYVFVTLMRPIRVALAMALTKNTKHFVEETQSRLGCSRTQAIGVGVSLGFVLWISFAAGGILLASTLSGVPIY